MKVTIGKVNSRGKAMLTIVRKGKSQTRHCQTAGDGLWVGHCLDEHKAPLANLEAQSKELTAQLFRLKIVSKPYKANTLFRYRVENAGEQYTKALSSERQRAKKIIDRQQQELDDATIKAESAAIDTQ